MIGVLALSATLAVGSALLLRRGTLLARLDRRIELLALNVERAVVAESRDERVVLVRVAEAERERVRRAPIWRWTP